MKTIACALLFLLAAFAPAGAEAGETKKLNIVATLFPQYDFARHIGGDRAEVKLLLPPGTDAHIFDPKPSDVIGIARADLFVYTGPEMEPWAEELISALGDSGTTRAVNLSEGMDLIRNEEHEEEEEHHGEEEHSEAEHDDHDHEHAHVHLLDPHIWQDPLIAITMVDTLLKAFTEADPASAALYTANAASLKSDLQALDAECTAMAAAAKRNTLVFGGKFAFAYFTRRYGLEHIGAYDSCGAGEEPSVRRVIEITDFVRANHTPVIFHEEYAEPRISKSIADATGCGMAMVHSLQNLTKEDRDAGLTFVELMRRNIAAFAGGLQ